MIIFSKVKIIVGDTREVNAIWVQVAGSNIGVQYVVSSDTERTSAKGGIQTMITINKIGLIATILLMTGMVGTKVEISVNQELDFNVITARIKKQRENEELMHFELYL